MFRAIGFDVGDTLLFYADTPLDWSSHYGDALATVARACKVSPSPSEFAAACQILSHYNTRVRPRTQEVAADGIFSLILSAWSLEASQHLEVAVDSFFAFFQQQMCAFPETLRVLRTLNAAGMRLGALTDVPYGMPMKFVQRDINRAQVSVFMRTVITSAMVGVRKPEVAGYHALAASLGVDPEEMLYVGNEPKDVIGAQRAGVRSVFIDRAGVAPDHGQTFTIASLTELREICAPAV
jgi:putative hydrolase of the HAD superfamily